MDLFIAAIGKQDFKLLSGRIRCFFLWIYDLCRVYSKR